MKFELIGNAETVMSSSIENRSYFAWPTVVLLQDGRICVGASGYRYDHICPFGKGVVAFSEDNGKSYSTPEAVIDTPLDDRDVGICTFGESGVIVTSFNNSADFQRQYNTDVEFIQKHIDTITAEDEEKYLGSLFRISNDCGKSFGKIFHSLITSPHGPAALKDGSVLWAGNNLNNYNDGIEIHKINTENGGTEYIGKITIDDEKVILCEAFMIELPDGKLLCQMRAENGINDDLFTVYQSISGDGGKSWTEPCRLLDLTEGAPPHIIMLKSGVLLCTFSRRLQPYGIMAMISLDNGKTWEESVRLYENTVSDDIGYPSTIELEDGTLLTTFYATNAENEPCRILQQKWRLEL